MRGNKDFITIVSGLPRSGTSMMMQILAAGGMPILTDNIRQPDADNPNGYYEFEPVKQLSQDALWLDKAYGKAVKIIYLLLYELPGEYNYKVIMMNRDIDEIIESQNAMLRHQGKATGTVNSMDMARIFQIDLNIVKQWLQVRQNFVVLNLNYNCIMTNLRAAANEINEFLGYQLDTQAMTGVLDVSLYRQRHF